MIVAIDVHYREDIAKTVSIEFEDWSDEQPNQIHITYQEGIEAYVPGEFYKRELPCLLKVLEKTDLSQIEAIVIDGYVFLDDEGKAGLGKYLYDALEGKIPIIGVAKRGFINNEKLVEKVKRGLSENPLYVTSIDFDLKEAAAKIAQMKGDYRMPTLLKIVDQKTKE